MNRETEKIYYNQRMIIDAPVLTEPRTYEISKINRLSPNGLVRATLVQRKFDPHHDYIEKDENGNVIGFWADYFQDGVPIEENEKQQIPPSLVHSIISYSGIKPDIKINGSGKKFTVKFYNDEDNENEIPVLEGRWEFKIESVDDNFIDATDYISYEDITKEDEYYSKTIRAKFIGTDEWINKNLRVYYISDNNIRTYISVNIVGL